MYYLEGENNPAVAKLNLVKLKNGERVVGAVGELKEKVTVRPFEISGLAVKFSRLKSDSDILSFASDHGFLGVRIKPGNQINEETKLFDFEYGFESNYAAEPLKTWYWHIDHVRKLIKLYNTLKTGCDIEDLLFIEPHKSEYSPPSPQVTQLYAARAKTLGETYTPYQPPKYEVFWQDGKHFSYENDDEPNMKLLAGAVLFWEIERMLKEGVFIDYKTVTANAESPFGFTLVDRKATKHLLAAIYYDLWRMINELESVKVCGVCHRPFTPKRSDAIFCGDACRKKNERQLKKLH